MEIKVICPACKKQLKAPETMAGKKVQCPACKAQMRLPELPPKAAAAAPSTSSRPAAAARTAAAPQARQASRPAAQPGQSARPAPTPASPAAMQPLSNVSSLFDEEDEYRLSAPAKPTSGLATRPCPTCGESIPFNAPKCQHCGLILDPVLKHMEKQREESKRKRSSYSSGDEDLGPFDWVLAILCTNIALIVGIVWLITGNPKGKKMLMVCGIVYAVGFAIGFMIGVLGALNQGAVGP
jgi:hypothetical protein